MALIDYKKSYGIDLKTWTIECFKMYKIPAQIMNLIKNGIGKTWEKLILVEINIQRPIFQKKSLAKMILDIT